MGKAEGQTHKKIIIQSQQGIICYQSVIEISKTKLSKNNKNF